MQIEKSYFNIPALSSSGINTFLNKSPKHFWATSPFNPKKVEIEKTDDMVFGSLCHLLLLENEKFQETYAIAPNVDKRTKEGKATLETFKPEGKEIITQEMFDHALHCVNALKSDNAAFKLLKNGFAEELVTWEEDGLACKAKLDYCRNGLVIDYKTTSSASEDEFRASLVKYGYHRQDYWYRKAYKVKFGKDPVGMCFIVQDKNLPEAINIYTISDNLKAIAEQEVGFALGEIKKGLTHNFEKIQVIDMPVWYKPKGGENV